ncbi:hypothetical protein AN958_03491 [Leucoagaricus sp. SymC.cos]|nr:hypothetical protein AN958_03491 [Leucoagaricus sp. SymC.cos]
MANKKVKSHSNANKKRTSAKQAYKKKQKFATKFRNDQLRESLDRQAQAAYVPPIAIPPDPNPLPNDTVDDLMDSLTSL